MPQMKPRRDPAPSLLKYRLQRLWLRPSIRRSLTLGPPLLVLLLIAFFVGRSPSFQAQLIQASVDIRDAFVDRDEFRVTEIDISGASDALSSVVRNVSAIELPTSSLDLDVTKIREQIEALPSVSSAAVRIGPGGVLQIDLSERVPMLVWRASGKLKVLDQDGVVLGSVATRLDRPDLPLILGSGADGAVDEALALYAIASPVYDRIRGLQRVGKRRWNLVMERDLMILLPENGPKSALRRVMALHRSEDLLDRDLKTVDMRDNKKPILRLGDFAAGELRRERAIIKGDTD